MEDFKKKNKGFKIFLIIFALIVLVFIQEGNQEKFISFLDKISGKEMDLVLFKEYPGDNLKYYKGSILKWEKSSLIFLNKDGEQKWVKDFYFMEPDLLLGQNYIYAMDKSTGDIYKINSQGDTILRLQLQTPIFNIKESGSYLMAHIKGEGERLIIIDEAGERVLDQPIPGNILTFGVNADGSRYVYSTIKLEGSHITSQLFVLNKNGKVKYKMSFEDEVVFSTSFINDQVLLLTDNNLRLILNGNVKWSKEFPLIKDSYIGDNKIYVLYDNKLEIMDFGGRVEKKVALGLDYEKILPLEKSIALYGNKNLSILQNGKEIIKYIGEKEIVDLRAYNDFIALHYEDYIEVNKLQSK